MCLVPSGPWALAEAVFPAWNAFTTPHSRVRTWNYNCLFIRQPSSRGWKLYEHQTQDPESESGLSGSPLRPQHLEQWVTRSRHSPSISGVNREVDLAVDGWDPVTGSCVTWSRLLDISDPQESSRYFHVGSCNDQRTEHGDSSWHSARIKVNVNS